MKLHYSNYFLLGYVLYLSCEIPNNPVEMILLYSDRSFAWTGDLVTIVCEAEDSDDDKITYSWSAPSGNLLTKKDTAFWTAPYSTGYFFISCKVSDGVGTSDAQSIPIRVVSGGLLLKGKVTNAVTGLSVDNVEVSVDEFYYITGDEGDYSLYIEDPTSSYQVIAKNDSFCEFSYNLTIPDDYELDVFNYNFSMSPIPLPGEIRFVLNWGVSPSDLDSHLKTPEIDSLVYHVFYGNRGNVETPPYAVLDVDDTDGYGPETITIKESFSGTYIYFIHQYSSMGSFPESGSQVRVYNSPSCGGNTITVPSDQSSGRYWYVCTLNGETGTIEEINQIVDDEP